MGGGCSSQLKKTHNKAAMFFSFKLRSLNTENSKGKFKNEKWQERRGKDVLNCKGYVWLWEKGTLRQLW